MFLVDYDEMPSPPPSLPRSHYPPVPPPTQPAQPATPQNSTGGEAAAASYAYEDDVEAGENEQEAVEGTDKDDMEQDLWTELDIDEDRDEPILKVTVVLLTIAVVVAGVRTHCCGQYRAIPSDLSPRTRAQQELAFAPDFGTMMPPPQAGSPGHQIRHGRGSSEGGGWSFDVFSMMASSLKL